MFDPQNGIATVVLFNGSNLSYNEEVIGLTGHCHIIRNVWPDAATLPEGTPARPLQQPDFE